MFRCIIEAAYAKFNNSEVTDPRMKVKRRDWLDYAPSKYSYSLIAAVRSFTKVLVMLLPLPLYHALSDQQVNIQHLSLTLINLGVNLGGSSARNERKPWRLFHSVT